MTTSKKPGLSKKLLYGSGDFGLNVMFTLFSSYVLYFYTDVVGMNAAIIGSVILASKIFDGVSDLFAGHWVDTHRGKRGHCIPALMKWSIPLVITSVLVFLVPDTSIAVRVLFVFVTYNLFNTVTYTVVGLAHTTLPSYVTDDPVSRSQMMIYKMLFAAITQTIMANIILPMVSFFGGEKTQMAWVKTSLLLGAIGLIPLFLNAFLLKETVENETQPENILQGIKAAFKNKYWLMTVGIQLGCSIQMMFNLSISVYYLSNVVGNMGLMGLFVAFCNLPGIVIMIGLPLVIQKFSKRNLCILGVSLCLIGQIVFCFAPADNIPVLMGTALIRGIGFSFTMGLINAMTADTIEYGEWKNGVRVQGVLFSAKGICDKLGQGLLTSAFGFFLTKIGYDGLAEVQTATAVSGIDMFFKYVPIAVFVMQMLMLAAYRLDREFPVITKELEDRRAAQVNK